MTGFGNNIKSKQPGNIKESLGQKLQQRWTRKEAGHADTLQKRRIGDADNIRIGESPLAMQTQTWRIRFDFF